MSIKGAQGVLLNISGGNDLALYEISDAAEIITQEAAEQANIIVGSVIDETLGDEIVVTVIATGFLESQIEKKQTPMAFKPAVEEVIVRGQDVIASRVILPVETFQPKGKSEQKESSEANVRMERINQNQDLDIPTFMRQPGNQVIEE